MNSTPTTTLQQPLLKNLTMTQRSFIEYFYINVYDPASQNNLWNPSLSASFSRSVIKSICRKFGYSGTIQWLVRKQFARRTDRGLYYIPEVKELHDLWETSEVNITIRTYNGQTIDIKRVNNKAV